MKKINFYIVLTLLFALLGSTFVFSFTPQNDINMRNFFAMFNATNITGNYFFANNDFCIIGGNCLSNVTVVDVNKTYVDGQDVLFNDSMKVYVDSQDVLFNDSMKFYVDSQDVLFNDSMKIYIDSQDVLFNDSMKVYVDSQITSVDVNKSYVDSQDILFNASMKVYVDTQIANVSTGGSDVNKSYVDSQDVLFNDSMKVYTDNTFITLLNEINLNVNSSNFWDNIDTQGDLLINWTQLQNYPSACPADTFVTQVGDTITCTGISDVYLLNTGDTGTGNYVFTGGTFDVVTLNTGQGDNELFSMNQNVLTTSSPTFISVSANLNGSQINTGTISSSFIQDAYLLNTGDTATGNYLFTDQITSIEKISFEGDTVNHAITDNATCVIITGDTSTFNIC